MEKHTLETFQKEHCLKRQSAINKLSKLKKKGLVQTSGGGRQPRIYTIYVSPQKRTNGFYEIVNKYSKEKLSPRFRHYTCGRYTVENAIIDGLEIGDVRTLNAVKYLFYHVKNWKKLDRLAKKHKRKDEMLKLYAAARTQIKTKKMPKRYKK